jgi:TolB-like protein
LSGAPDIFLSYNREDQARARTFAEAFGAQGFNVWWDTALKSGEAYDQVTEKALRESKAVVVLWSSRSVASHWVRSEASIGQENKNLVPVKIEACELPVMFRLMQTSDLSGWKGDADDARWQALLADVRRFVETDGVVRAPVEPAARPALSRRTMIGAGAAVGAVALAGAGWALWPKGPARRVGEATLAVLPFENLSSDAANAFMADGIAAEVLNGLQRVRGLRVIARTSSFALREENLTAPEIGTRLGADVLVQGSVQQSGRDVRVTTQLVDGKSGQQMWSDRFQNTVDELFALQDRVCAELVRQLPNLLAVQNLVLPQGGRPPVDPETFRNLLEARDLWAKTSNFGQTGRRDEADAAEARALAIIDAELAKNPNNADALAIKAFIWIRGGSPQVVRIDRRPRYEQGKELLARAVSLDPDSADANALLGEIQSRFEYQWADAERAILRALEVNPNHAEANSQLGYHYSKVGRAVEALPYLEIAARLDPLYQNRRFGPPRVLPMLDREAEAVAQLKAMAFGAEFNFVAARDLFYIRLGHRDAAGMQEVADALKANEATMAENIRGVQVARMEAALAGVRGRPETYRRMLAQYLTAPADSRFHSENLWSYTVETLAIGDIDKALDLFQMCIDNQMIYQAQYMPFGHSVPPELARHPRWNALWTSDPRLAELTRLRLDALRRRQFLGTMPDGTVVRPG